MSPPDPIFVLISSYSILLPAAIGIIRRKKLSHNQQNLSHLVWGIAPIQMGALIVSNVLNLTNNLPLYHLYVLVEFVLVLRLMKPVLGPGFTTGKMHGTMIAFGLLVISNAIWVHSIFEFPSFTRTLESALIIVLALLFFIRTMRLAQINHPERSSLFWVSSSMLVFYTTNLLLFVYAEFIVTQSQDVFDAVWFIHAGLNILLYLGYSIALLCREQKKT